MSIHVPTDIHKAADPNAPPPPPPNRKQRRAAASMARRKKPRGAPTLRGAYSGEPTARSDHYTKG
jgi:hypothetical protein